MARSGGIIDVDVKINGLDRAILNLAGLGEQQRLAAAVAITLTARDVRDKTVKELPKYLDRPVEFTKRSFGFTRATERNLESKIYARSIQAQYLWYGVEGGTQDEMIQPGKIRLNQFGNLPREKLKNLLTRPDMFYGTVRGITGIWQRGKQRGNKFYAEYVTVKGSGGKEFKLGRGKRSGYRGLKLIAVNKADVKYKKRFPFHKISRGVVDAKFDDYYDEAIRLALATAK